MAKIYTLSHPLTNEVRYIGKTTKSLDERFKGHYGSPSSLKGKTKRETWLKSLYKQNLSPVIELLDEVDDKECDFWEKHYISLFKSWNLRLTNGTMGGTGGDVFTNNPNKEQIRIKLRNRPTLKGRKFPGRKNSGQFSSEKTGKDSPNWQGYVYVYNPQGNLEGKYETIREAAKKLNNGSIAEFIRKNKIPKFGRHKGYKFKITKNEDLCNR